MAVSLIENLSGSFDPEKYEDEFQAAVQTMIRAKVEGAPLPVAPVRRGEKVVDLMEALRASVEATRKKSASPTRKRLAADRRRRKTA